MFIFPFYGYPYNYPYYRYYNNYSKNNVQELESTNKQKDSITTSNSNEDSNTTDSRFSSSSEQVIFEIFGLKLYLDDLIILCVLFFLYQQNVQDEMLYIILFLLLFS